MGDFWGAGEADSDACGADALRDEDAGVLFFVEFVDVVSAEFHFVGCVAD